MNSECEILLLRWRKGGLDFCQPQERKGGIAVTSHCWCPIILVWGRGINRSTEERRLKSSFSFFACYFGGGAGDWKHWVAEAGVWAQLRGFRLTEVMWNCSRHTSTHHFLAPRAYGKGAARRGGSGGDANICLEQITGRTAAASAVAAWAASAQCNAMQGVLLPKWWQQRQSSNHQTWLH